MAEAVPVVREMLREGDVWCRLEQDGVFGAHVGYDYYYYYLYLGAVACIVWCRVSMSRALRVGFADHGGPLGECGQ